MDSFKKRVGRNWPIQNGLNANRMCNNGPRFGGSVQSSQSSIGIPSPQGSSQSAIETQLSRPSSDVFSKDETLDDLLMASLEAPHNIIFGQFEIITLTDQQHYNCRDVTLRRMNELCECAPAHKKYGNRNPLELLHRRPDVSKLCRYLHCYTPTTSNPSKTTEKVLDRFSVISVPAKMDFDANFTKVQDEKNTLFTVHHIAAINIGEERHATDFVEYCHANSRLLDENRYVRDMSTIFRIALATQHHGGNMHAVWFPLGMGAFLRLLPKYDATYTDERMRKLRRRLADSFVREVHSLFETSNMMSVHLCIGDKSPEAIQNAIAFMSAIVDFKPPLERLSVWWNADASAVAQFLANQCLPNVMSVSLVNGANSLMIGNHWFANGADRAIDENLHRRSLLMSLMAFLVNGVHGRTTTAQWVAGTLDGRCYQFDQSNSRLTFTRAV